MVCRLSCFHCHEFFFFNDTATTEIYTLSLHDALPISSGQPGGGEPRHDRSRRRAGPAAAAFLRPRPSPARGRHADRLPGRSEEHTSELQSRQYLVCRLLLEKKKNKLTNTSITISPQDI